ncbi:MAG: long-chain fatty acid--CoA ligase [Bacteroides sp.]|nr:long-chain fatty acid--CoA ligase [Bacteroides sp.]MDD4719443.1 long-chain fatty acid--CoA ligase [Bacteroides sp.]
MNYPHLSVLIRHKAKKYGKRAALKYRNYATGKWVPISWNQFSDTVDRTANALAHWGVEEHENIGIFSQNKPEYLYVDFGAFANRSVTIPFFATSSPSQVQYMINDAQVRYVFVGEQFQYDTAFRVIGLCPTLKQIIIFDKSVVIDSRDEHSIYFEEFLAKGNEVSHEELVEKRRKEACPEDLANILYTSGTTGESKGVTLHHSNYLAAFVSHDERLACMNDKDVVMSFLPLAHIFEKAWVYYSLYVGCLVCINLNPADIQKTLKEVRPTLMSNVPRFWEKVYIGVQEKIESTTGITRMLMLDALKVGKKHNIDYVRVGKKPPLGTQLKYKFYEKTVYTLLKKTLGLENGKFFPTAGATVPDEICEFVHSVGINMLVGYGLTESTATVSCYKDKDRGFEIGSVGTPMPGIEVKIGENNEILLRGETITKGYYNKEKENEKAFDEEGFFRTGDAGFMKNGELYLTERIKDLFKTSNGKYITPQALEAKLLVDRYIDQIAIIADQRKFVSALIVPDFHYLDDYAKEEGIKYDSREELIKNPRIIRLFEKRIETLQQQFAHYEQIKKFTLLSNPFSIKSGELTTTLKLRRGVVAENYKEIIEKMYREDKPHYNPEVHL